MPFENNCPINEQTGDGTIVGRCWFHLPDGKTCPRHGDVSIAVDRLKRDGMLTLEENHFVEMLRLAGCQCEKPLLGERQGGRRCRLCNTIATATKRSDCDTKKSG